MKILVTGAGGKTGQAVAERLLARGMQVRGFFRRAKPLELSGVEAIYGDMLDPDAWQEALTGVDRVYHIAPNMHPAETAIGLLALQEAKKAAVSRFVYHSVLHPQAEEMPHHWQKLRVEEALFKSGLPYAVLQPAAYMQNILPQWAVIKATGVMTMPYPVNTRISLVDLADVSEAAAIVLIETGYEAGSFELVGSPPLSQEEIARELSQAASRPVTATFQPLEEWAASAGQLPVYARETLLAMFRYYAAHGFTGSPVVLGHLLGRPPRSLADCAAGW